MKDYTHTHTKVVSTVMQHVVGKKHPQHVAWCEFAPKSHQGVLMRDGLYIQTGLKVIIRERSVERKREYL